MTIPASGAISLGDVLGELQSINPGRTLPISLGDADVLALAGKSAPPISLSDLYGKQAYVQMSGSIPASQATTQSNPATNRTEAIPVVASIYGGIGPYSYSWTRLSGAGTVDAVNSPSTVSRIPVARFSEPGEVSTQTVQVVVTDSTGRTLTLQGTVTLTLT